MKVVNRFKPWEYIFTRKDICLVSFLEFQDFQYLFFYRIFFFEKYLPTGLVITLMETLINI